LTLREQAVLVTGVGGSSNQWQTQQQAYLARKAGIHVVAVGAGRWLDRYELNNVVSQPRTRNAIFADSFSTLHRDATASVRNIICNSEYIQPIDGTRKCFFLLNLCKDYLNLATFKIALAVPIKS